MKIINLKKFFLSYCVRLVYALQVYVWMDAKHIVKFQFLLISVKNWNIKKNKLYSGSLFHDEYIKKNKVSLIFFIIF